MLADQAKQPYRPHCAHPGMGRRPSIARNKLYNWVKRVGDKGPAAQFYRGKQPIWKGMKQLYEGLWAFRIGHYKKI
jgi:hypothetical protein